MRINYNASAMRANNALNVADNRVAASLQKLSSGYKVNSAKDNPSGYAIGRRMSAQITGVTTATQNAKTGISVIETADGALTEVHDMLQRMNELAVKGETGTLTTADRKMLDQELQQLKNEVARIARDTEFNGQPLLDGSFDLRGYTNDLTIKVGYYSDEVLDKVYTIDSLTVFYDEDGKIDLDKTKDAFVPGNNFPKGAQISSVGENCFTITDSKGFEITLDIPNKEVIRSSNANVEVLSCSKPLPAADGDYVINSLEVTYDANGKLDTTTPPVFAPGNNFPA
ncbi:MAG: flagellin, partial [Lachnospiraceae bacterium]|nr:flagellin [Lachnospiraceae bacterium]